MNWNAIGAIGEILGAAGVILTLAYLAVQIRQNTKVARSTVRQALSESAQQLSSDLILNKEIADIFIRNLNGDPLDAVETLRLQGRCYRDMQHWENIFFQMREGMLPEEEWAGFRKNLGALFGVPAYREYWQHEHSLYSASFQKEVIEVLQELETNPDSTLIADRFRAASVPDGDLTID